MNEATFKLVEAGGIAHRNVIKETILSIMKTNVDDIDIDHTTITNRIALGMASSRTLREFLIPDREIREEFQNILEDARHKYEELIATPDVQARLSEVAKKVIEDGTELAF